MPHLPLVLLACCLLIAAGTGLLGADAVAREGGPIESASLAILASTALAVVALAPRAAFLRFWHVPFLLLLLAEREYGPGLDWVDPDVLTPTHWATPPPLGRAIPQAALAIGAIWALVTLLRSEPGALRQAVRERAPWLMLLLAAAICAVVAQMAEEIGGTGLLLVLEEGLEAIFAILLAMAMIARARVWRGTNEQWRDGLDPVAPRGQSIGSASTSGPPGNDTGRT